MVLVAHHELVGNAPTQNGASECKKAQSLIWMQISHCSIPSAEDLWGARYIRTLDLALLVEKSSVLNASLVVVSRLLRRGFRSDSNGVQLVLFTKRWNE